MNIFKKYRINSIFFGSFFIFTILILIIIIFVSYRFSANQIVEKTTDHQKDNLYRLSEELEDNLQTFQDYSVILSRQQMFRQIISGRQSLTGQPSGTTSLTNDFSNVIYSVPAIHSVEIYMNSPPVDNIQYPVRYFDLGEVYDSDWYDYLEDISYSWLGNREVETMADDQAVISLGRKINSSRGQLQAMIIINLDPITVESWLRKYHDDSHIVLLDNDGAVVASTGNNEIGDEQYQNLIDLSNSEETVFDDPSQDQLQMENDLIVTTTIPYVNWTVMEVTPYSEIIEGSKEMAKILSVIAVIATMIVLVGTFFLTKKFTDPIIELTKVMKSYQLDQSRVTLPKGYKNEFGQLFNGFEELTNRVEELYSSLKEQHQRQREAEIKALQANINPHFLYNTLDQLNWIAIEKGNIDISRMIELLGKMLRIGLSKGESIITVDDELKYLEYYMRLQKIQLEDRFSYTIDAPKGLLDHYIPKLTFQPFVENAIIHGFRDRRIGIVEITFTEQDDLLKIEIKDNGIGFQIDDKINVNNHLGGYGIKNVTERLNIYYGEKSEVNIDSSEKGTVVTILIPKINDKKHLSA
ncbi:sensor histidine kinase [Salipaludibacillus sp. HK11]|uniref:sensor histidine kinase n=1 Tax=Salipaludibacillus sp. HK11 TaxID=3394320 RepID=UPI0039FC75A2